MFQHEGVLFAITDYTVATLTQVIASGRPLEEIHISAVYRQASFLWPLMIYPANIAKVFEGMEYLSMFGIAHINLDSTKVLFSADGCVKVGMFNYGRAAYQLTKYSPL